MTSPLVGTVFVKSIPFVGTVFWKHIRFVGTVFWKHISFVGRTFREKSSPYIWHAPILALQHECSVCYNMCVSPRQYPKCVRYCPVTKTDERISKENFSLVCRWYYHNFFLVTEHKLHVQINTTCGYKLNINAFKGNIHEVSSTCSTNIAILVFTM
jgi:hypothetical protein